jgi:hypothetical protein
MLIEHAGDEFAAAVRPVKQPRVGIGADNENRVVLQSHSAFTPRPHFQCRQVNQ